MKKESVKTSLVIAGAILFNIIFWNEKLAVNALLFSLFLTPAVFYLYPYSLRCNASRWLFASHLLTATMVILHNTFLSKLAFSITMLLFVAFSQYLHRSVWYAGGSVILNYVFSFPNFWRELKILNNKNINARWFSRPLRMFLVPMCIAAVFMFIYALANQMFSQIAVNMVTALQNWFMHLFDWFSIERLKFFISGFFITAGLLLATRNNRLSDADMQHHDYLLRKKNNFKKWRKSAISDLLSVITGRPSGGMLALKNELTIGLISLILLNLLLLFINLIDVKYVWLGFRFSSDVNMAAYVHEGAGLLILSIVLAMLVLLFFFRGNINFYRKNKWLKYGAYLWIFQNLFLVFSVLIRDYYYISHFGLAYKRIGLLFFLVMVVAGLLTVFIKIRLTMSTYFLLRINAWIAVFVLVFASAVNWDITIARYNLARKSSIPLDVAFLLSLSDDTLPLIEKNKEILDNIQIGRSTAAQVFEFRKKAFVAEQKTYSWLSWNVADAEALNKLKTLPALTSLKN